jgi:hypothetical protein
VWKYLSLTGITAIVVGALIFLLLMLTLSMFFPLRGRLAPKLLPSLPSPNEKDKKRLPIREYGPGLWATGGTAEDKNKRESGVLNTDKPIIEKDKQ